MESSTSSFLHWFNAGGPVMYPLLLMSVVTVAIAVERFFYFAANQRELRRLEGELRQAAGERERAQEVCAVSPAAVGRVLSAGLLREKGAAMKEGFCEQMAFESAGFQRHLEYLSAIVTCAPLLGLLGTVTGMIHTFSVLDNGGGASAITGGVGEALIATASGLCIAIVAFCVYTYFDHQLNGILHELERLCNLLLRGGTGAEAALVKESWEQA